MTQSGVSHFYIAYRQTGPEPGGIAVLDAATGRIRTTQALMGSRGLAARSGGAATKLYALSEGGYNVSTVDTRTLETDTLYSDQEARVTDVAVNADGSRVLLAQGLAVLEVDTASGKETGDHAVPQKPVFTAWATIALSPDGKRLYLGRQGQNSNRKETPCVLAMDVPERAQDGTDAQDDNAEETDPGPGQAVDIAAPAEKYRGVRVLLSADGATLYAFVPHQADPLVAIDTATLTVTARAQGPAPTALAASPDGTLLYAVHADRAGTILNAADLTETGAFPSTPDKAPAIAVAPDGTVCVAYSDHTCTVIAPDAAEASAPARLAGAPLAVVTAAASEADAQPQPEYVGRYRRDAMPRRYNEHSGEHGMWSTDVTCEQGAFVPAYDKVYEGSYTLTDGVGVWRKAVLGGGESKKFYRIPSWDNLIVDGDDVTWL
ncbi:WD40 repeat domain-containing protein [Streptomyces sp. NPDC059496]|uniref:WD40 repeat domain-containing protein n=1 Tax=Streptomyces sp. NPDC059496 TaxID=3346851 RepID=UPI00367AD378